MTTNSPTRDIAIKLALESKWDEACAVNQKLLAEGPHEIETLNRLAYTYVKLGKYKKAKEYYQEVISIDKTNPIALKNLRRIETMSQTSYKKSDNVMPLANMIDVFIEEAGKTKTVDLKNITDKKTLSVLEPGENVMLAVKRSKIFVLMADKTFIGMLPDNIGMRMITFINGGNEYSACVKGVEENAVSIFIRETKKAGKFKNQPSFVHIPLSGE